jgi:hypothetical protein
MLFLALLFASVTAEEMTALQAAIARDGIRPAWIEASREQSFGGIELVSARAFLEAHLTAPDVCRATEIPYGFDHAWTKIGDAQHYAVVQSHEVCAAMRNPGKRIAIRGPLNDADLRNIIAAIRAARRVPSPQTRVTHPDGSTSIVEPVEAFPSVERKNAIGLIEMEGDCARVTTSRRSGAGQEVRLCKLRGVWMITGVDDWVA